MTESAHSLQLELSYNGSCGNHLRIVAEFGCESPGWGLAGCNDSDDSIDERSCKGFVNCAERKDYGDYASRRIVPTPIDKGAEIPAIVREKDEKSPPRNRIMIEEQHLHTGGQVLVWHAKAKRERVPSALVSASGILSRKIRHSYDFQYSLLRIA